MIVPPELGSTTKLAGDAPVFISHSSSMEIHRMVTQPQLAVFASSSKRLRSRVLHGTEFRFVFTNVTRLVDYALQLGIGAVIRRLDLYRLAPDNELARLRTELTDT